MSSCWLKRLLIVFTAVCSLSSCTNVNDSSDRNAVTRKLVTAKSYTHPDKKSIKEDMQVCRNTVPKDKVDECLSEKGWTVFVKKYD